MYGFGEVSDTVKEFREVGSCQNQIFNTVLFGAVFDGGFKRLSGLSTVSQAHGQYSQTIVHFGNAERVV